MWLELQTNLNIFIIYILSSLLPVLLEVCIWLWQESIFRNFDGGRHWFHLFSGATL